MVMVDFLLRGSQAHASALRQQLCIMVTRRHLFIISSLVYCSRYFHNLHSVATNHNHIHNSYVFRMLSQILQISSFLMSTAGALIVVTVLGVSTHPVRLFAPKPPHPLCPHVSSINHDDNVCHVNNVSSVSSYSAVLPQSLMVFFSLGILWPLLYCHVEPSINAL